MRYGAGLLPVCPPTGRALVLLRSENVMDYPLTWAAAGGGEEPSDDGQPIVTAVREFVEETGYFPSDYIAPLASARGSNGLFHLFTSIENEEFTPVLNFENEEAEWFDFNELMELSPKHPVLAAMLAHEPMQFVLHQMMTTL